MGSLVNRDPSTFIELYSKHCQALPTCLSSLSDRPLSFLSRSCTLTLYNIPASLVKTSIAPYIPSPLTNLPIVSELCCLLSSDTGTLLQNYCHNGRDSDSGHWRRDTLSRCSIRGRNTSRAANDPFVFRITFKTLLRQYAKWPLTHGKLYMNLGRQLYCHK